PSRAKTSWGCWRVPSTACAATWKIRSRRWTRDSFARDRRERGSERNSEPRRRRHVRHAGLELDLQADESALIHVHLVVVVELGLDLAVADIHEAVPDHLDLRAHADVEKPLAVQQGHDAGCVEGISPESKRPVAREPAQLAAEREGDDVPAAGLHGVDLAPHPAFDARIPESGIAGRKQAQVQ